MKYSLDPREVKKVIDAKRKGLPHDRNQFLFYHLHRNYFNVKSEVTNLRHLTGNKFVDNLGHSWEEQSNFRNFFHMPKTNWVASMAGVSTPYSRKFLRDDHVTGLDGEFEMIIRHDGKRIDALTHGDYQETYNFGRTRDTGAHKTLDVDTHRENSAYTFRQDMGKVLIIQKVVK